MMPMSGENRLNLSNFSIKKCECIKPVYGRTNFGIRNQLYCKKCLGIVTEL